MLISGTRRHALVDDAGGTGRLPRPRERPAGAADPGGWCTGGVDGRRTRDDGRKGAYPGVDRNKARLPEPVTVSTDVRGWGAKGAPDQQRVRRAATTQTLIMAGDDAAPPHGQLGRRNLSQDPA